jgi:hypothetical protein
MQCPPLIPAGTPDSSGFKQGTCRSVDTQLTHQAAGTQGRQTWGELQPDGTDLSPDNHITPNLQIWVMAQAIVMSAHIAGHASHGGSMCVA